METLWHLLLLVHMEVGMSPLQGVENLIQLARLRQQHPRGAKVHQVEGQVTEGEAGDLGQDDLFHQPVAIYIGHAVVCCDDDVQAVGQSVLFSRVADVTHRSVNLLDHLPSLWGVWAKLVTGAIRLAKVQGHKVQILLTEPVHHLVCVLSPSGLVLVVVKRWLHFLHHSNLSLVTGSCARKVKRASFQALEEWKKEATLTSHT